MAQPISVTIGQGDPINVYMDGICLDSININTKTSLNGVLTGNGTNIGVLGYTPADETDLQDEILRATTAENTLSTTKEDISNKVTSISGSSTDTQYPSAKLVYTQLALKSNLAGGNTFTGDQIFDVNTLFINGTTHRVGFGTFNPALRAEIFGTYGLPASSGTAQNGSLRLSQSAGTLVLDQGLGNAAGWLQVSQGTDLTIKYPLLLNPNGGNVAVGMPTAPDAKFQVRGIIKSGDVGVAGVFTLARSTDGVNHFSISSTGTNSASIIQSGGSEATAIKMNALGFQFQTEHDNVLGDTVTITLDGSLNALYGFSHKGSTLGFYNATPISKPAITGSRGGNVALASLLTQLATLGLITDSTAV